MYVTAMAARENNDIACGCASRCGGVAARDGFMAGLAIGLWLALRSVHGRPYNRVRDGPRDLIRWFGGLQF